MAGHKFMGLGFMAGDGGGSEPKVTLGKPKVGTIPSSHCCDVACPLVLLPPVAQHSGILEPRELILSGDSD